MHSKKFLQRMKDQLSEKTYRQSETVSEHAMRLCLNVAKKYMFRNVYKFNTSVHTYG